MCIRSGSLCVIALICYVRNDTNRLDKPNRGDKLTPNSREGGHPKGWMG